MSSSNQRGLLPRTLFPFSQIRFPSFFGDIEEELAQQNWPLLERSDIDISSDDKNVYVKVPVAGLDPNDVETSLENGVLWIKGEKQEKKQDKDRKIYRESKRSYSYRIALPEQIDETKESSAKINKGILEVTLPKAKQSQSKKIQIKNG